MQLIMQKKRVCPAIPLRLKIWIYRFRTNDHVQQCAGRFTSAFRGFYHPYDTIEKIRKQIYEHYNLPEELLPLPKASPFEVKTRRRSAEEKEKEKKQVPSLHTGNGHGGPR